MNLQIKTYDIDNVKGIVGIGSKLVDLKFDISPTYNCQLFSIGGFCGIFDENLPMIQSISAIKKHFNCTKKLMLIDVNDDVAPIVEKEFEGRVVLKSNYTSTNGSEMYIMIINTENL